MKLQGATKELAFTVRSLVAAYDSRKVSRLSFLAVHCDAGTHVNDTGDGCQLCDYGYYQSLTTQTKCEECPPYTNTTSTGATRIEQCKGRASDL